ncbi:MAG: hypothetical protein ACK448_11335 [Bacteroidota bacterium]
MINKNRQIDIFNQIIKSLNLISNWNIHLELPQLEIEDEGTDLFLDENNELDDQHLHLLFTSKEIFDMLGYFSVDTPSSVFLVENKINVFSEKQKINKETLIEIIYIHECAHYIHYHLNTEDFINWNKSDRPHYVESWAQLLTERMVNDSDFIQLDHKIVFDMLLLNQESEYTDYRTKEYRYTEFPDYVILNYFLLSFQLMDKKFLVTRNKNQSLIDYLKSENLRLRNLLTNEKEIDLIIDLADLGHGDELEIMSLILNRNYRKLNKWLDLSN